MIIKRRLDNRRNRLRQRHTMTLAYLSLVWRGTKRSGRILKHVSYRRIIFPRRIDMSERMRPPDFASRHQRCSDARENNERSPIVPVYDI